MALTFCFLAALLYATEIVITDKHLSRVSPVLLTGLFGLGIMLAAVPGIVSAYQNGSLQSPSGHQWTLIAAVAILSFFADWSHFSALERRAGSAVLATFYMLLPVICSLLKFQLPSSNMILAWLLGGVALFLVSGELNGE